MLGGGGRFADYISFSLKVPLYSTETKLFHFHSISKNGCVCVGWGGPAEAPLDSPLLYIRYSHSFGRVCSLTVFNTQ